MKPVPPAPMKHLLLSLLAGATLLVSPALAQIAPQIQRARLHGIDIVAYPTGVQDVVYLRGTLPAGTAKAPAGNPMIPTLVAGMLSRGTTLQSKNEITARLDAVGASINFAANTHVLEFSARCLAKDVPLVVALLAEQLRSPAFTAEEFARLQQQTIGNLQRALESTDFRATDEFSRAAYSPGHANRSTTVEERIAAVRATQLDDLKRFHAEHYGPAHLTLVAAGDLDVARLNAEIDRAFAGWTGGTPPAPAVQNAPTDAAREQVVFMPDKTSVSIVIGQPTGLRYQDADAIALRAGTAILGSGFTGRLMANVRDKEGLTYGIGASVSGDTFTDGDWRITATFAPALLERGIASTRRQLDTWYRDGVTADELERRKDNLVGSFQVGLATTEGLAQTLLLTLSRGKDLGWIDEYPHVVRSLTVEQVNGTIKKHLDPEKMFLIKAGTVPGATPETK